VVSAYDDDPEVDCEIPYINMKNVLLTYPRNADRRPCLATVFHARVGIDIVKQHLDVLRLKLVHLFRVSKYADRIHRTHQHSSCKCFGQIAFNAFLNDSSCLIRHTKRLECLKEYARTLLADLTHHIHGPLEACDASFDIKIWLLC